MKIYFLNGPMKRKWITTELGFREGFEGKDKTTPTYVFGIWQGCYTLKDKGEWSFCTLHLYRIIPLLFFGLGITFTSGYPLTEESAIRAIRKSKNPQLDERGVDDSLPPESYIDFDEEAKP